MTALLAACSGDIDTVATTPDAPRGGAPGDSASSSDGAAGTTAKQICVLETNRYRAMLGKPALAESPQLESYAEQGAMVDFSSMPHNHFISTSGGGIASAENECPVQGNWMLSEGGDMGAVVKQCIAAFYAEGPGGGHYENMMGGYGKLGCGMYQMGTGLTIVQDYGY